MAAIAGNRRAARHGAGQAGLGSRLLARGVDPGFPAAVAYAPEGLARSARFRTLSL